jgi:Chaperone of endosialidase
MSIKITIPNTSSDVLTFGSANTPTAAQIAGIDSGSSNGQLALYTTASGTSTERVRVDSSGNFVIGATSALSSAKLSVNGFTTVFDSAYSNRGLEFQPGDNTNNRCAIWTNTGTRALAFGTSQTEQMRLDTSGNLLVGATSRFSGFAADNKLYVESSTGDYICHFRSTQSSPFGPAISFSTSPNGTSNAFIEARDSTTARFSVRSNGGIYNFSANNSNLSDERTKTDIQNAGGYLAKICAIPVRTFKYKDQTDDLLNLGVIAQEVEAVAPELVDVSGFGETPEDGIPLKAIYQTDLQYALMKCIQEQQALITQLQADVAALKGTK